jgi:hypothetical protein
VRNLVEAALGVHAMFMAPPKVGHPSSWDIKGCGDGPNTRHVGCETERHSQGPHDENRRDQMFKKTAWASVILSVVAIPTLAGVSFGAAPAEAAVVYCKTVGVPKGCVVRPTAVVAPVRVAPVAGATVGHVGYTHVGPVTGVTHVGATTVRRW